MEMNQFRVGRQIINMTSMLGKKLNKKEIQTLYRSHLTFLNDLESVPLWMKAQGKALWSNLKMRYKSTLTRGEQLFHQTPMALGQLMRATSSSASQSTPAASSVKLNHTEYDGATCKLCFDHTIDVLFPACRHAGVCKGCYTTYLNENGKQECPFCRKDVLEWSEINVIDDDAHCKTLGCSSLSAYIGHRLENNKEACGHLLYCKPCKTKCSDESGSFCSECKEHVQAVRIYLC
jgi:hypothetical protein